MTETTLWHFTCDHGRKEIGGKAYLVPGRLLGADTPDPIGRFICSFVWLTTEPTGQGCGLESIELKCDRLAHRYRAVQTRDAFRWVEFRELTEYRYLETVLPDLKPESWWLSLSPVLAVYDPVIR